MYRYMHRPSPSLEAIETSCRPHDESISREITAAGPRGSRDHSRTKDLLFPHAYDDELPTWRCSEHDSIASLGEMPGLMPWALSVIRHLISSKRHLPQV